MTVFGGAATQLMAWLHKRVPARGPCSSCGATWRDCTRLHERVCCDDCLMHYRGTHPGRRQP